MEFYAIMTLLMFGFIVRIFYLLNSLKNQNYILKRRVQELEDRVNIDDTKEKQTAQKSIKEPIVEQTYKKNIVQEVINEVKISKAKEHIEKEEIKEEKIKEKKEVLSIEPDNIGALRELLLKGNPLVKVGGFILFVGLSFLLKFAISNHMISIEMGLIFVAITGLVLVGVGLKYRNKEGNVGLILQGTGFGVFYLDIFASAKFFTLLTPAIALLLMVIAVVCASLLAIKQNSLPLAIFAIVGGFLAPISLSTNSSNHLILFSYYSILNVGILLIAYKRSWRILNLIGFFFTFAVGFSWGLLKYESQMFLTTEPFVVFFFLLYVLIGFMFAKKVDIKAYIDTILIFGAPVSFLIFQNYLSKDFEHLLTLSSLGAGIIYLTLAYISKKDKNRPLLLDTYLVLGVIFLSFIIAFELSSKVASWIYAFEASGAIWISFRQDRTYGRYLAFALSIYAVATYVYGANFYELFYSNQTTIYGYLTLSFALFISSYMYKYFVDKVSDNEKAFYDIYFFCALALWLGGGVSKIGLLEMPNSLLFYLFSIFIFAIVSVKLEWEKFMKTLEFMLIFALLGMFYYIEDLGAPFRGDGFLIIPLVFLVYYFILHVNDKINTSFWHVIGFWSIILTLNRQVIDFANEYKNINILLFLLPIIPIISMYLAYKFIFFEKLFKSHKPLAINGMLVAVTIWWIITLFSDGGFDSFSYVPILNPIDFMQIIPIIFTAFYLKTLHVKRELLLRFIGISSLVLITIFLARFTHQYLHVNYDFDSLWKNNTFQTLLSILYTLISFGVIFYANKYAKRDVWMVGAGLLGFVIIKLFFVELASSGTLQRVISFIGVGILVLIIGFIAPMPPKIDK